MPRHTLLLLLVLTAFAPLCYAADQPVKAAFMYSGWPNGTSSFKDEFDRTFATLGWQVTKFENTQAKELSDRLSEFNVVVGSSVSNYANPQDFKPFADKWQAFLENGGIILATDASYAPINVQWIGGINPAFSTSPAICSAHSKPSAETAISKFADAPLLTVPGDLRPALRAKTNWSHLGTFGSGWTAAVTCYDDKPVLVYRPVGKGLLIVTNYFSMKGDSEIARGLLQNALTMTRLRARGLELTALEAQEGRLTGNQLTVRLKNVQDQPASVSARLALNLGDKKLETSAAATVQPGAEAVLPLKYDLPARGHWAGTLDLLQGDQLALSSKHEVIVPELIAVKLPSRHQYVHRPLLRVGVTLAPELRERLAGLTMRLSLGKGSPLIVKPTALDSQAQLSLDKLPPGDYTLIATLLEGQKQLASAGAPFIIHPRPPITYDANNITYVNGKPFFPLGMYQVGWSRTKEQKIAALREMAAAGFNCAHMSCTSLDDFQPVLDEAQRLGMMLLIEGLGANYATVHRFKDHPAVLGWNSGDEPDCSNTPPEEVGRTVEALRDADWSRLIYTTVASPDALARYAPYADVFTNDPYPVTAKNTNTIAVARQTARARESVAGAKPLWMVPQCFGYADGHWAVPTPAQERSMTYQTVIEGARGLVWYTFDDKSFMVLDHPELWAMMKQLVTELKALTPVLLQPEGKVKRFTAGPEDVIRAAAIGDTIMAAHTNDKDLGPQELTIPGLKGKAQAEVLFENRTVSLTDGKLTDNFAPYAVHVYRVKQ
ncbi:MAG: hypothetical protein ABFE07_00980 [Armatimonadia bacterium]